MSNSSFPNVQKWNASLQETLEKIQKSLGPNPSENIKSAITIGHETIRAAWRVSPYNENPVRDKSELLNFILRLSYPLRLQGDELFLFRQACEQMTTLYGDENTPTWHSVEAAKHAISSLAQDEKEENYEEIAVESIEKTPKKHLFCNLDFVTASLAREAEIKKIVRQKAE